MPVVPLNDREIRPALLKHLRNFASAPKAVLEEIRVHNGNAVADIVAVHRVAHCYEIKGEADVIARIGRQGAFYDQAFQRVTLVTTENHLVHAKLLAPSHWGILLAEKSREKLPTLRYIRKATNSPKYDKQVALLTLWRSELLKMLSEEEPSVQKMSRSTLTQLIAETQPLRDISKMIGQHLVNRQASSGWSVAI